MIGMCLGVHGYDNICEAKKICEHDREHKPRMSWWLGTAAVHFVGGSVIFFSHPFGYYCCLSSLAKKIGEKEG